MIEENQTAIDLNELPAKGIGLGYNRTNKNDVEAVRVITDKLVTLPVDQLNNFKAMYRIFTIPTRLGGYGLSRAEAIDQAWNTKRFTVVHRNVFLRVTSFATKTAEIPNTVSVERNDQSTVIKVLGHYGLGYDLNNPEQNKKTIALATRLTKTTDIDYPVNDPARVNNFISDYLFARLPSRLPSGIGGLGRDVDASLDYAEQMYEKSDDLRITHRNAYTFAMMPMILPPKGEVGANPNAPEDTRAWYNPARILSKAGENYSHNYDVLVDGGSPEKTNIGGLAIRNSEEAKKIADGVIAKDSSLQDLEKDYRLLATPISEGGFGMNPSDAWKTAEEFQAYQDSTMQGLVHLVRGQPVIKRVQSYYAYARLQMKYNQDQAMEFAKERVTKIIDQERAEKAAKAEAAEKARKERDAAKEAQQQKNAEAYRRGHI